MGIATRAVKKVGKTLLRDAAEAAGQPAEFALVVCGCASLFHALVWASGQILARPYRLFLSWNHFGVAVAMYALLVPSSKMTMVVFVLQYEMMLALLCAFFLYSCVVVAHRCASPSDAGAA